MLKLILGIVFVVLLPLSGMAGWEKLDGTTNAPWYGTAKCFSAVTWNDQPWIFAADGIGQLYRSSDLGETWLNSEYGNNTTHITAILADPYPGREGWVYIARYDLPPNDGINGFWMSTNFGRTWTQKNGVDDGALGNTKIMSIRKYDPGTTITNFANVVVTCFTGGYDYDRMIYEAEPSTGEMYWRQLFQEFPFYQDGHSGFWYSVSDFAQNCYDVDNGYMEFLLPLFHWGLPIPDPANYGIFKLDFRDCQNWCYSWGIPQQGYKVWAGAKFFRYRNSDINSWPIYELGSWRYDIHEPSITTTWPEIIKYNRGGYPDEWDIISPSHFPGESENVANEDIFKFTDMAISGRDEDENCVFLTVSQDYKRWDQIDLSRGIYVSTNGGPNWSGNLASPDHGIYFNSGRSVISFPKDPNDPLSDSLLTFFGSSQRPAVGIQTDMLFYGAVYKSTNRGQTWAECTKHMNTLRTHEIEISHDSLVACGTTNALAPDSQCLVSFSTDIGSNWTAKLGRQILADNSSYVRDMKMAEGNSNLIAIAFPFNGSSMRADSIFVTNDWGATWVAEYGFDLTLSTMIWNIANTGDRFYASMTGEDYVIARGTGFPATWAPFGTWDPDYGSAKGLDAGPYATDRIVYAGTQNKGVKKRVDNASGAWMDAGLGGGAYTDVDLVQIIPSVNSNTVIVKATYSGVTRLLRTTDGGGTWIFSDKGIPDNYKNIQAVEPLPGEPHIVLATAVDANLHGKCFLSLDMGYSWNEFNEDSELPSVYMKDIAFWQPYPVMYGPKAYIATDVGLFRRSMILGDPTITSDTTWTSGQPIYLMGDLNISAGATLTIQPGTKIYFAPDQDITAGGSDPTRCEIIVNGELIADATGGSPIYFVPWVASTVADSAEWYGIGTGTFGGSVTLNNCVIESAIYGVKAEVMTGNIRHCTFRRIADTGIFSDLFISYSVADSNSFENCYDWAIDVCQGYGHNIIGNQIADCKNGIRYTGLFGSTVPVNIKYNVIENSLLETPGDGIRVQSQYATAVDVCYNTVSGYSAGIYLSNVSNLGNVNGNFSHDNLVYGIYLINVSASFACGLSNYNSFRYNDEGISCNGSTNSVFTYNKASDNSGTGVYVASGATPNFGYTTPGNNSIVNPSADYDFYRVGTKPIIQAQNCYWGGGAGRIFGGVNAAPYLTTDPLPGNPRRDSGQPLLPEAASTLASYPNPFNPQTTIAFTLSSGDNLRVEIYNIMGQKVQTVADGYFDRGEHSVIWDGQDSQGNSLASGVYFAKLTGAFTNNTVKMTLLR